MQAVILCGGRGMRMRDAAYLTPKPLVEVGGMPILWQIMKLYKAYGINDFILCLGYKGEAIKEFFLSLNWKVQDFQLTAQGIHYFQQPEAWNITFADTDLDTMTGGRIKRIEKYINEEVFMLTYCDGLADIPLDQLLAFHKKKGKIATVTGIKRPSGYGIMEAENGVVTSFREKPLLEGWVNGGFFVLKKDVFRYIRGDQCIWEEEPLRQLVEDRELAIYPHRGYWQSLDTPKDVDLVNKLWAANTRPWVRW